MTPWEAGVVADVALTVRLRLASVANKPARPVRAKLAAVAG